MDNALAVRALGALAHETRLFVYRLLVRTGPEGMAAGEIAEQAGVPNSTLTAHLNALVQAGLLTRARQGTSIRYAADFGRMNDLLAFLTENCCGQGSRFVACDPTPPVAEDRQRRLATISAD
jgi:DNA-binding transcriptional ArsR family regulator